MNGDGQRPKPAEVLAPLKGFQRSTVDYAFDRLYQAKDSTRRFLVADEVGLGKTLVARGVVARAIDHMWPDVERIDIVYICSNSQIARQNVSRLQFDKDNEFITADRLTLLPTVIHDLRKNRVNYLAFTPGTSFDLKSSLGRQEERILLYWMVQNVWPREDTGPKNLFQGDVKSAKRFRERLLRFRQDNEIDQGLLDSFGDRLEVASQHPDGSSQGLRERYHELCDRFHRKRERIPDRDRHGRSLVIGELRSLLAETCVRALEPDLIILDEFQRFKKLLSGDDDAALLADKLFNYSDAETDVRLLLLSATPYKMYTLHHESQEDDHYEDFLRTIEFLDPSLGNCGDFEGLLREYRQELYRVGNGGELDDLRKAKERIETKLRRVMARTERLRATAETDGMLREQPSDCTDFEVADVRRFVALQEVGQEVGQPQVIEYWKSSPYLLNFMDQYKLKSSFRDRLTSKEEDDESLVKLLGQAPEMLLPWDDIEAYREIDAANARLRSLLSWMEERSAWKMLWLPPSFPYHRLEEPWRTAGEADLSKRLVFSTWNVVPKVVACLASYAAERQIFLSHDVTASNTPEERKKRRSLLRFAKTKGRLTGMPVLGFLYPSPSLARSGDPLLLSRELLDQGVVPTADDVLGAASEALRPLLAHATSKYSLDSREDESWYWAAPILLDLESDESRTREWFAEPSLPRIWSGENGDDDMESRWVDHVERARDLVDGRLNLGQPPADLLRVVALMAVGGPASCVLRALTRSRGGNSEIHRLEVRAAAGVVAWDFRTLFSSPEAMALLRADDGPENTPYWQRVLEYGSDGQLQAVLDEYVHILQDLEGVFDKSADEAYEILAPALGEAVSLRTGTPGVDNIQRKSPTGPFEIEMRRLRNHFAIRFGTQESDDGKSGAREDQVRRAFNSPFWPFVLTTTSVGQEGLDFHAYCHAVVHWNLPSNPVDLEQREGRVHRYKGHAVRKNVARDFGSQALSESSSDAWSTLFELAERQSTDLQGGLVPYWVYSSPNGSVIERHVPRLPLSRDDRQLENLRQSLAVYRMVFGQPRQDDLMSYLIERVPPNRLRELESLLQIDLVPPEVSV